MDVIYKGYGHDFGVQEHLLEREIQWCIYKNLAITINDSHKNHSHKHVPFCSKWAKIGSIMTGNMILVSKSIDSSREIQWWLRDCFNGDSMVNFIDIPLNFPTRVDTFRRQYHVCNLYKSDFSPFRPKKHMIVRLYDCVILGIL